MTHPLRVAEHCTTNPLHEAQNLMTHPLSAPAHLNPTPPPPPSLYFLTSPWSERLLSLPSRWAWGRLQTRHRLCLALIVFNINSMMTKPRYLLPWPRSLARLCPSGAAGCASWYRTNSSKAVAWYPWSRRPECWFCLVGGGALNQGNSVSQLLAWPNSS